MTTGTDLPLLDDLTTPEIRVLARAHLGDVDVRAASAVVRPWAIRQGVMPATAIRGPISRAAWTAYAAAHRLGIERPTPPAPTPVGGQGTATRCRCTHLRIDHRGGTACRPACGCLQFVGATR